MSGHWYKPLSKMPNENRPNWLCLTPFLQEGQRERSENKSYQKGGEDVYDAIEEEVVIKNTATGEIKGISLEEWNNILASSPNQTKYKLVKKI